jgi:N-acetylmuramoyl-L-alanine amidase
VVVPVLERTPSGYLVRTPCGNETELVWGQPLRSADVVLDAGHGGDERGALGPSGETEAELNLDIARRTAAVLDAQGVTAVLTRTGDYRIPISNRAAIADQLSAEAFVSIHHNSPTPDPSDRPGTEVYAQVGSEASRRLGGLIHEEVVGALSAFDVEWSARTDAGVLTVVNGDGENAYGINRYPATPSVLAELAYLSNPSEAAVLATPEYRQAAADALASGIVRYLRTADGGSGFVEAPRLFNPSDTTGGTDGCVDPQLT